MRGVFILFTICSFYLEAAEPDIQSAIESNADPLAEALTGEALPKKLPPYLMFLHDLGAPTLKFSLKGNQDGLQKSRLRADFPLIKPITIRFSDSQKKNDFIPFITIGDTQHFLRLALVYDSESLSASLSFLQNTKGIQGEDVKSRVIIPISIHLDPLQGARYFLDEIKVHLKGLRDPKAPTELDLECSLYESSIENKTSPINKVEPCFLKGVYSKEEKKWTSLEYQISQEEF